VTRGSEKRQAVRKVRFMTGGSGEEKERKG
jgi:hypothetical protein